MVLGIRYHMVSIPAYNYPSTSTFERNMVDGFNGFNDFSRQAPVSIPLWAATRGLVFGVGLVYRRDVTRCLCCFKTPGGNAGRDIPTPESGPR